MDRILRPLPHISWRELKQEIVLLNMETSSYYSLNPTAVFIWRLIIGGASEKEMLEELLGAFRTTTPVLRRDFAVLKKTLIREKLVRSEEAAGDRPPVSSGRSTDRRKQTYAKPVVKPHGQLSEVATAFKP